MKPRTIALISIPLFAIAIAAGVSAAQRWGGSQSSENIASLANRFAYDTQALFRELRATRGDTQLTQDAKELAREAAELSRDARYQGNRWQVRQKLIQLQDDYDTVRAGLLGSGRDFHVQQVAPTWARIAGDNELLSLSLRVPARRFCELDVNRNWEYGVR